MIYTPEVIEQLIINRKLLVGSQFVLETPEIIVKYGVLKLKMTLTLIDGYLTTVKVISII